jgi:S1-C subfamily serine protease
MMYLHDPAVPVAVTALRGNQVLEFGVPAVPANDQDNMVTSFDPTDSLVSQLGIFAKTLTVSLSLVNGLRSATGIYVVATTAGTQDSGSGLASGDVIVSLNGVPMISMQEFRRALHTISVDKPAVLEIERQRQIVYLERELGTSEPQREPDRSGPEQSSVQGK